MTNSTPKTRVLLIGKDARTDALAAACLGSSTPVELYALSEMRIPGLVHKCGGRIFLTSSLAKKENLVGIVKEIRPDLVIIGPEEPLEAGYADELSALGIPVFGPISQLARIETSKAWARELLSKHDISGNPEYRIFTSTKGLREYMDWLGVFVVKPDGLTAGKGVRVLGDHFVDIDAAFEYAQELVNREGRVQIEERLDGEEFSLQTITDGRYVVHCPAVQDHKRAYDGDKGPNTGGMGSYSCADFSLPFLEACDLTKAQQINERVIEALERETGKPYRGVLYGGFMATHDGVRLIEYNCRFGDPEAMNVLPLLQTDFVELCWAATRGDLASVPCSFKQKATVCKYIVPDDYPERSLAEAEVINVSSSLYESDELEWYWAACTEREDGVYMTSSRSGAFVGIGDTLVEAEAVAERAASRLEAVNKVRHRSDVGRADVINARIRHMKLIRGAKTALDRVA